MARPSIGDGCLKDLWDTLIIEPIKIIVNFETKEEMMLFLILLTNIGKGK